MNILPFVIAMLMVFSVSTALHMRSSTALSSMTASVLGWHRSSKRSDAMACHRLFLKLRPQNQSRASTKPQPTPAKAYQWHRQRANPVSAAKLNISSLLEDHPKHKQKLTDIAAALIYDLYHDKYFVAPLKDDRWHYTLLEIIIKELKKQKTKNPQFSLLSPSAGPYKLALYKVLKGSCSYDIQAHRGIPPFEEMFTVNEIAATPINFTYALEPVLKAVFGVDIVQEIQHKEKEKSLKKKACSALTKHELIPLLEDFIRQEEVTALCQMLSFSTRFVPLDKLIADDKTSSVRSVSNL